MKTLAELIEQAGTPLSLADAWPRELQDQIGTLCQDAIRQARRDGMSDATAVRQAIIGMYVHGFTVGRDHGLRGMRPPDRPRRGLEGIDPNDLTGLDIPSDLSDL